MTLADMFDAHPSGIELEAQLYLDAIAALEECARICTQCADACVAERDPARLRDCIAASLDCADLCAATARILSRQTDADAAVQAAALRACIEACERCATVCEGHADHMDHCQICADACRACDEACRELHRELDGLDDGASAGGGTS
jgi:hypothetical protein